MMKNGKGWKFILAGLAIGICQSIYYVLNERPINLVLAPGELAAFLEKHTGVFNVYDRVFPVNIDPVFLGVFVAAAAFGFIQAGKRPWVRYPVRVLAIAGAGGFLFGAGANLAGGDFLYHTVAGVALLETPSLLIVALSIPFLFISLEILSVFNVTPYYQLDQSLGDYGEFSNRDRLGKTGSGRAISFLLRGTALALIAGLAVVILLKNDLSLSSLGLGALLGLAAAGTGFGVEWSMLVPEIHTFSGAYLERLGISARTSLLLKNFFLLQGWLVAVAIFGLSALVTWVVHGTAQPPPGLLTNDLNIGHVAGALLLPVGSIMMLGSDLRSYSRLGLGYGTAFFAFLGLLAGYLPTALWSDRISSWLDANIIAKEVWLPRLVSDSRLAELAIWSALLGGLIIFLLVGLTRQSTTGKGASKMRTDL